MFLRAISLSRVAVAGGAALTAFALASPSPSLSFSSRFRRIAQPFATAVAQEAADAYKLEKRELLEDKLVLYQYMSCPFCNKVRAALDFYNVPYKMVEVDPLKKKEIKFSEYKKVPILLVEGSEDAPARQLNDSTAIISSVAAALGVRESPEEQRWRAWVDDKLVHLLPANIYRSPSEALASFDYLLSQSFDFGTVQKHLARYVGASVMYLLCRFKLNKKYGITEPREQLYAAADDWSAALGDRDFLSGTKTPGVADVTVFGAFRSLEGLDTFRDLMANSKVGPWYDRMRQAVGAPKGRYVKPEDVRH